MKLLLLRFSSSARARPRTHSKPRRRTAKASISPARAIALPAIPCAGGKAFAGGLRMGTPMGAIYSTNITPDPDTGIGNYSLEDFDRAVRSGVAKDGHHLYPAMPYPSYAKISDDDLQALYAFFMKEVPPVKQANKQNEIPWYFSPRWPLAIWNAIFAPKGAYVAQQDHDAAWNRGAYLVEGLGHCGACHTPRGWAFQEKALRRQQRRLSPRARSSMPGRRQICAATCAPVSADGPGRYRVVPEERPQRQGHRLRLHARCRQQQHAISDRRGYRRHGGVPQVAAGDGAAGSLRLSRYGRRKELQSGKPQQPGAAVYLGFCSACHGIDGKGQAPLMPPLAGNPAVLDANPSSLINLVLNGAEPLVVKGIPDAYRMPQYRIQLNDEEIAQVLSFVRGAWGNDAAPVTTDEVKKLRPVTDPSSDRVIVLKMR